MATQYDRDGSFDLFGLPRELRNMIYNEILEDRTTTRLMKKLRVTLKHTMTSTLATVSRQFREECQDCASKKACVVLGDTEHWPNTETTCPVLPQMARDMRNMEFHLVLCTDEDDAGGHKITGCGYCLLADELRNHTECIKELLSQLQSPVTVHISLYVAAKGRHLDCLDILLDHQSHLQNWTFATSIRVWQADRNVSLWKLQRIEPAVAQWSAEKKCLIRGVPTTDAGGSAGAVESQEGSDEG